MEQSDMSLYGRSIACDELVFDPAEPGREKGALDAEDHIACLCEFNVLLFHGRDAHDSFFSLHADNTFDKEDKHHDCDNQDRYGYPYPVAVDEAEEVHAHPRWLFVYISGYQGMKGDVNSKTGDGS